MTDNHWKDQRKEEEEKYDDNYWREERKRIIKESPWLAGSLYTDDLDLEELIGKKE